MIYEQLEIFNDLYRPATVRNIIDDQKKIHDLNWLNSFEARLNLYTSIVQ